MRQLLGATGKNSRFHIEILKETNIVFSILHAFIAIIIVFILYFFASFAVRQQWKHFIVFNPLKILSNVNGRASLSSIQLFFFSLIVMWLATYWVLQEGNLVPLDNSVLGLLGIAVLGSGVGKITDATRFKVTAENWAWAKKKNWIKKDFTKASPDRSPEFGDLFTSVQGFDITRFQAVGFSLILGIALIYNGATAADAADFSNFYIDEAYLALIGISQGAYVGGKYINGNLFRELNEMLDKVRSLEISFTSSVAKFDGWKNMPMQESDIKLAIEKYALSEYVAYMSAATNAVEIVRSMTGNIIKPICIQPGLPYTV